MYDFSPEARSELKTWAAGQRLGHHRRPCPDCSNERINKTAQCLSVEIFSDHLVMKCHHCERSGAVRLTDDPVKLKPSATPKTPASKGSVKRIDTGLTQQAIDFLQSRHISVKTAQAASCVGALAFFRDLGREEEAVAFPYYVNDKVVGYKARCVTDKKLTCSAALHSLFMVQLVDMKESDDFIICEGEIDPLSFYEAGVLNATSVPNGSSSFSTKGDDGNPREALGFLWEARSLIEQAKRIIIATDADEPGDKLAEELARRIGKHRCWRVRYPDGCKDANDVLVKFGKDAVRHLTESAEPWPVEGLYEAEKYFGDVVELFENGFGDKVKTGLTDVDEYFSVGPGLLTVVTGIPGHGKSTFVDQIMVNLARAKGYSSLICSFENPPAIHIGKLVQCIVGKHFFHTEVPGSYMSKLEMEGTLPFVHSNFKFMHSDDGKKVSMDNIIEKIKTAVFRWGVRIVVVDPYNYISRPKNVESETQFIDDVLSELRLIAQLYGLHIFFVAHPTKLPKDSEGNYQPPKGFDISGSAAWFSKPDFGLTVHRVPQSDEVEIHVWKVRFDWLGKVGKTTIRYDNMRHTYENLDGFTYGDEDGRY